ncbi:pyruvate dehydrogenase (acetyl-transferring) E1 component subunit alpha [Candidatus Pacearchaeota archaeon]|nr:pyruvate dehydrogenase (acetyl-transferring) E1 component subunit alpha [Candidatus Pacearchaeota archaeon]
MEKTIANFSVKYLQILDEKGNCDEKQKPKLPNEEIKKIYELLILTRVFDEKALNLQRQGRLGTYASVKGQEACQIGSAILLQAQDYIFPAFREHGVFLTLGIRPSVLFQYWGGDERGMQMPKNVNILPVSIPVGSHPIHAVGAAMAFNYLNKKSIAITYFGDGATSEGDFHEAMNFAGVFKAPVIFICQNNQFAISFPVKEQTAAETLAQKAIAYGFEGIRIDGNDIFAVYQATKKAIEKARAGKGPTFVECFTYRMGDHTTSDDSIRYRSEKEVKLWEKKDPIERLKNYMLKNKIAEKNYFLQVRQKAEKLINDEVEIYEKIPVAAPDEIFNYVYASLTDELKEQLDDFKKEIQNQEDK